MVGAVLYFGASPAAADEAFVLVKGAGVPVAEVTAKQLRALFLGETRTWDGGAVVQIVRPVKDDGPFAALATQVFRMPASMLRWKMNQEVFKGELRKPLTCTTVAACLELVKTTAGAIAVVSAEAAAQLPAGVATVKLSD